MDRVLSLVKGVEFSGALACLRNLQIIRGRLKEHRSKLHYSVRGVAMGLVGCHEIGGSMAFMIYIYIYIYHKYFII